MKKIYSILVTIVFLILTASCNENFEIADKADSLVSVAINTLNIQKSFNVGESYQAELWVQRGGLSDMSGKVKFMIDPNLLDSLNREDRTNYQMLPENCYELSNIEFLLNKNEMCGYITYHPEKIVELSDYDQIQYVLPLRLCFIIGISGIRTYCTNHKLRNIQYRSVTNLPNGRPHQRTFY